MRRSTSVSTRLMKKEATLATAERSDVTRGDQAFEAGLVCLDDRSVALDAEDEGHVDAATLTDHLFDGRDALGGGRDLDQQVRPVDALVQ